MWDSVLLDFLYLSSDFMSGKSIPALLAVTHFHLDPHLLGTMVLLGCFAGAFINMYRVSRPHQSLFLDLLIRFVFLATSCLLSLSLLKRIMSQISSRGVVLGTIPAFWVISHFHHNSKGECMSEKPVTLFVFFAVSLTLYYFSLLVPVEVWYDHTYLRSEQDKLVSQSPTARQLLALSRQDWYKYYYHKDNPVVKVQGETSLILSTKEQIPESHPLSKVIPQCLYIFIFSVYSTLAQGAFYSYTGKLCSPLLLFHRVYAFVVCILAALFRAYVFISLGWLQGNMLHLVLEGSHSFPGVCWCYMVVLMLSVQWNSAQICNQILTIFQEDFLRLKTKFIVVLFAVAYLYQWKDLSWLLLLQGVWQSVWTSVFLITF